MHKILLVIQPLGNSCNKIFVFTFLRLIPGKGRLFNKYISFLSPSFKVNTFKNNADQILFNHKEAEIILILIETEKDCKIEIEHYVQPFWILIILAGEGRGESLYLIYFLPSLINFCYDNFAIP